ncbi:MAG: GNAT family N-acetyltransferase [Dermatophilaceae bacterium]
MGRRTVEVHMVDPTDLRDLGVLWLTAKVDAGTSREVCTRTLADGRFAAALGRLGVQAFLARLDQEPVGYVITSDNPFGLGPTAEVAVEQLWVRPDVRRHGVAKALLGAVLGAAERAGCETVVSNVPTSSREANRFFARLGFGAVTVRRVVSTTALRRRLAPATAETGTELLRRRRNLRHRAFPPSRSA